MNSLPKTLPSFFWHFIKKQWPSFLLIQFFCLGMTIDHTAWPYIIKLIVDTISTYTGPRNEIWDAIFHIVIGGFLVWLLIELFFRFSGFMMARTIPQFEANIRMTMFEHASKQSHTYFSNNFAGSLANRINDMPRSAHNIMTMFLTVLFPVFVTTIVTSIIFMTLHPLFGFLVLVWVTIHIGICVVTSGKSKRLSDEHAASRSMLIGRIVDSFSNNVSMRLFANRKYEIAYTQTFQDDEQQKNKQSLRYVEIVKIYLGLFCFLFMGVFLTWLQVHSYQEGVISLGDLVYSFQAATNVIMVAWWAGLELPVLFQEMGVCKQALSILTAPVDITDAVDAKPLKVTKGEIKFENVTFNYERNSNIFERQNITLAAGKKVGLVGFSGSGKTTFVNLILRYFDINEGRILIDDQDISKVTQDSLRLNISMIPQEPVLFHRTLMENIRYGRLDATDEEVIEAAKKAHCHEFIIKMSHGYHTIVGERGLKLSGGQRQRIAIARAILKNAPILILDEATSALDSVTEKYIQESVNEMAKGCTSLIIAHRLSTLADVDRILVFKDGCIIEDGTHEDLIALEGHYFKLWTMQNDGVLPESEEEE